MPVLNQKLMQYINFSVTTACMIGFSLSLYSLLVELNIESDPNYVAMCDISEHMSCTKAFSSQYGKGFGLLDKMFGSKSILNQPNSLYGMVFYTLYIFINMVNSRIAVNLMIGLALISNIFSLYLASILIFILKDFCVVCVSTYFINATLLFLSMYKKHTVCGAGSVETTNQTVHEKES